MFDLKFIRENPDVFDRALKRRGAEAAAQVILTLDSEHRAKSTEAQEAQARRNEASKLIGKAKSQGNEDEAQALMAEVAGLKDKLADLAEEERVLGEELNAMLMSLPNMVYDDVPQGVDEDENVEVRTWGGHLKRSILMRKSILSLVKPLAKWILNVVRNLRVRALSSSVAVWRVWNAPSASLCWTCTPVSTVLPRF